MINLPSPHIIAAESVEDIVFLLPGPAAVDRKIGVCRGSTGPAEPTLTFDGTSEIQIKVLHDWAFK